MHSKAINSLSLAALLVLLPVAALGQIPENEPLELARVLAARYPETPSRNYISALSWTAAFGLSELSGEDRWAEKARLEMQPFLEGERPAIAEPYRLTSLAVLAAFSDLGELAEDAAASALAAEAAELILPTDAEEIVRFATEWTDDMFMATSLLARVADRSGDARYPRVIGRLLTAYAERLQRPDGIFVHSLVGPFAWGRGNGFAALGLAEALTYMPEDWSDRTMILDIYRRQMRALVTHQSDDGSWRQVVDEPGSYRELTVTATTVTAMSRGIRLGWLDREEFLPVVERGWQAIVARVGNDGTVSDVCVSTGARSTREYYLERPILHGADDRGGGLALLAAVEVEKLGRALDRK